MKTEPKTKAFMQSTIDKLWADLKAAEKARLASDNAAATAKSDLAQIRELLKMTRTPIQRMYEIILDADPAVNVFSPAFGRTHDLAAQARTLGAERQGDHYIATGDTWKTARPNLGECPHTGRLCEQKCDRTKASSPCQGAFPNPTHRLCAIGGYCPLKPPCALGVICARIDNATHSQAATDLSRAHDAKTMIDLNRGGED